MGKFCVSTGSNDSEDLLANAKAKLESKKLDLILVNDVSAPHSGFGTETNQVTLLATALLLSPLWPLHAAMFLVVLPIAVLELSGIKSAANMAWQALANLFLLHAWIPWAGRDGLAQTFNGPSWTLSCEAFFYAIFPALAILALRRFLSLIHI